MVSKPLICSVFLLLGAMSSLAACKTASPAPSDPSTQGTSSAMERPDAASSSELKSHRFEDPERYAERWNDPGRDAWQHPEQILEALDLAPGARVADIGAGTGYLVAHLSRAVGQGGEVIAIDVETSMIEYLAKRKGELGPATITPRKVSAESPALKAESVDGAVTLNTWHHIGSRRRYAEKVFEGLKPGGRFVVVEFDVDADQGPPESMRLEPEVVLEELRGAGFEAEQIEEAMPRHYMIVGTRPR